MGFISACAPSPANPEQLEDVAWAHSPCLSQHLPGRGGSGESRQVLLSDRARAETKPQAN